MFYHFELGLNVLLFDAVALIMLLRLRPELSEQSSFKWSVAGWLFSAISVVIVNSWLSIFAHAASFVLVIGFSQIREIRFIWFGLLLGLFSLAQGPKRWWIRRRQIRSVSASNGASPLGRWLKQTIVPVFIVLPFLLLYQAANEAFASGLRRLLSVFNGWSFDAGLILYFSLFIWGCILAFPLLFPKIQPSFLAKVEASFTDYLSRRSGQRFRLLFTSPKIMGLKYEYRRALMTLGSLNLLLFVVNLTDLRYVWLSYEELPASTLSHFVHLGTYSLLASVGLAMVLVVWFFRGNLNFMVHAPLLKVFAYVWLGQNVTLLASVAFRNYRYVEAYGLATGRVEVAFVLALLLFGLLSLYRKVRRNLSFTYLLHANGMAAWLGLLLFAAVQWDGVITRYNIVNQASERVDWGYLVRGLSDANTFLLLRHPEQREFFEEYYPWSSKINRARRGWADWRSWNYADHRNYIAAQQHLSNDE